MGSDLLGDDQCVGGRGVVGVQDLLAVAAEFAAGRFLDHQLVADGDAGSAYGGIVAVSCHAGGAVVDHDVASARLNADHFALRRYCAAGDRDGIGGNHSVCLTRRGDFAVGDGNAVAGHAGAGLPRGSYVDLAAGYTDVSSGHAVTEISVCRDGDSAVCDGDAILCGYAAAGDLMGRGSDGAAVDG